MANFSYAEYAATVAAAQNKDQGVKVGFFKLNDGDEALVRFNISSVESLQFASIHRVKKNVTDTFPTMSVSCLNPLGHTGDCPLCAAAEAGDSRVMKANKRVYVQLLISYKDSQTGKWLAPVPVIWERPAGFYKEVATLLSNYGDLRNNLFKVVRAGAKLDTRYQILYAAPAVFKPELIPADFSAFDGYDISKRMYWTKTISECNEFLEKGTFPEVAKPTIKEPTASIVTPQVKATVAPHIVDNTSVSSESADSKPEDTSSSFDTNFGGFNF